MVTDNFLALVKLIVTEGVTVTLSHSDGELLVDLNTGMKSHCYLYLQSDNRIRIDRRFNVSEVFDTISLREICERVANCHHGRKFHNPEWVEVCKQAGHPIDFEAMYI
jgi:hypothetical protein